MRILLIVLIALLALPANAEPKKLQVVASFSIVEDIAKQIGGEHVEVTSLIGRGADAHHFEPTAADAKRVKAADLIIVNGLGFEPWMPRLIETSNTKADIVEAARGIKALPDNPHAWHDLANGRNYARTIATAFAAKDPAHTRYYGERLRGYLMRIAQLHEWAKQEIIRIPASDRRVAVPHNTFAYFEKPYGFTFVSPQGASADSEPSAEDIAAIVRSIRDSNIKAIFTENIGHGALMEQIAKDSGVPIGGTLYTDALSPYDGEAGTYLEMMHYNIAKLASVLAPKK